MRAGNSHDPGSSERGLASQILALALTGRCAMAAGETINTWAMSLASMPNQSQHQWRVHRWGERRVSTDGQQLEPFLGWGWGFGRQRLVVEQYEHPGVVFYPRMVLALLQLSAGSD